MKSTRLEDDFQPSLTQTSQSVLLEVMTILGSYRNSLVLVGGWAPYFLIETHKQTDAYMQVNAFLEALDAESAS